MMPKAEGGGRKAEGSGGRNVEGSTQRHGDTEGNVFLIWLDSIDDAVLSFNR
jgi:hypothetical protein